MLYVVGTPIGNLNDLSYRQAETLAKAEIILTEDTRTTGLVLDRIKDLFQLQINPEQKIISYYKEKEFEKLPYVLELLENEKEVALISQAGMPVISDPGYLLIKTAIKRSLPFTVIPGPTAVTTSLLLSGFNPEYFMFVGFFPKKENELKRLLTKLIGIKALIKETVFVAYESPNRIIETLKILSEIMPENEICITREMTKKFEEVSRGKAEDLMNREYKGEITLLIS